MLGPRTPAQKMMDKIESKQSSPFSDISDLDPPKDSSWLGASIENYDDMMNRFMIRSVEPSEFGSIGTSIRGNVKRAIDTEHIVSLRKILKPMKTQAELDANIQEQIYGFQRSDWLKNQQEQFPTLHSEGTKHHFGNDIVANRRPRSVQFQIGRRVTDNALIAFLNWLATLVVWGTARVFRKARKRWERIKDISSIHDLRQDILRHIDRAHYKIVW